MSDERKTTKNRSDEGTTTSSQGDDHENFEILRCKVMALCRYFCPRQSPSSITVSDMQGGAYNHIIGIDIKASKSKLGFPWHWFSLLTRFFSSAKPEANILGPGQYILRIPWTDKMAWLEHEIAIVKYVGIYTNVPVADIVHFDLSRQNQLGLRYTIQSRLSGERADDKYRNLNADQRVSFAEQLGEAMAEFGKKSYRCPGILDPESTSGVADELPMVRFFVPARNNLHDVLNGNIRDKEIPAIPQTPLEMFNELATRQVEQDTKFHRLGGPWERFMKIAEAMNQLNFFHDDGHYLCHFDLEPRNMLIDIRDRSTANLSGIIDWDMAIFAPAFMHCKAPQWLWDWSDGEEGDERKVADAPTDLVDCAVKRAFEDAVGQRYLRYAYTPEYRIARNMFRLAIEGIEDNESYAIAENIISDWNELHSEYAVECYLTEDGFESPTSDSECGSDDGRFRELV